MKPGKTNGLKSVKHTHIKIYTSRELIAAFATFAAEHGRSVSKQGEYLLKQALANEAKSGDRRYHEDQSA